MSLQLLAPIQQIQNAIDDFPANYHTDYFSTRTAAKAHLSQPNQSTANSLAAILHQSLRNWGAGRRVAPQLQSVPAIEKFLLSDSFAPIRGLSGASLSKFAIDSKGRIFLSGSVVTSLSTFDNSLIAALNSLRSGIFMGSTNVTYPMKALLLITGLTPALDSQVRNGLSHVGFRGTKKTQFLLPPDSSSSDAQKITRLPFFMGQCLSKHRATFHSAIAGSKHPTLISEPGRLFDVLFFMQATIQAPMFRLTAGDSPWYSIQ